MFKSKINRTLTILLLSCMVLLVGCNQNKNQTSTKDYQEEINQALGYVEKMDWENALSTLKEIPEDYDSNVTALKAFIETQINVNTIEGQDEFERNYTGYNLLHGLDLTDVDTEIVQLIEKTRNEYKEKVDEIVAKVEPTEKQIVEEAYELLNTAIKTHDDNRTPLMEEVKTKVSSYEDFKSDYKIDAHILYLYAEQSLLIESYWANKVSFENEVAYSQSFADKHTPQIIVHLKELDPENKGFYLPEHVLDNLKNGLNNFFYITEADWQKIYEDPGTDWIELSRKEARENDALRNSAPKIGMSELEVILTTWGGPKKINKTTTSTTVYEQWIYSNYRYVYLENGIVVAIQE